MKKIWIFMLCVLTFTAVNVTLSGANSAPANKNLLNPERLEYTVDLIGDVYEASVITALPIDVEADSPYTFSVPSSIGSDVQLLMRSDDGSVTYIDETFGDPDGLCTDESNNFWVCTFESTRDDLHIELHGGENLAMHLVYHPYEFDGFQLEEGFARTEYIRYEPLVESPPEFVGEDSLFVSYVSNIPLATLLEENVVVYDEIDGTIPTEDIIIVEDAYTGNEMTAGEYTVVLEASDSSGNTSVFNLSIHVYDLIAPIITGPDVLKVDVNEEETLSQLIKAHFTFHDDHDGALSDYEVISDTYTNQIGDLGESSVAFEVSDASGNTASHTVSITVEDYEAPVITGAEAITVHQSDMLSEGSILGMYSATDNHTAESEIALGIDAPAYSKDASSGTYDVSIHATDASGNQAVKTVTITVLDDIAPVIYAERFQTQSYTDVFDLDAYISSMTVTDNDDETLSSDAVRLMQDDYIEGVPGTYTFEFAVDDRSGNTATHTYTLEVIDDVGPVFETVASVHVDIEAPLSADNLQALLMQDPSLQTFTPVGYEVLEDSYSESAGKEGSYLYTVEYTNAEGDTLVKSLDLQVATIEEAQSFNYPAIFGVSSFVAFAAFALWRIRRR